ncbi:MAG: cytochrome c3 family protein [Planctomycetota bacterium]
MDGRLVATLAALAAVGAFTSFAGRPAAVPVAIVADPQDPPADLFKHDQHVPDVWAERALPEVWRDCRGCHRFSAQQEFSAPQAHCDECHVDDQGKATLVRRFKPGFDDDLRKRRTRTSDAFRHHTHGMLACRECHLKRNVNTRAEYDVVTGPGQCVRCHERGAALALVAGKPAVETWEWFEGALDKDLAKNLGIAWFERPKAPYEDFAERVHRAFAGPTGGVNVGPPGRKLPPGDDFDHFDHGAIQCQTCHTGIEQAAANGVGAARAQNVDCDTCHYSDARRKPVGWAPAKAPTQRVLHALGAFEHRDHFRFLAGKPKPNVATEDAYRLLRAAKDDACAVCHVQDKVGQGSPIPDYPFFPARKDDKAAGSKNRYLDCAQCHAVDGWLTGETSTAPLHDSSDGRHDEQSAWGQCEQCHDFAAADFAMTRPLASVQRFTGRTFEFTSNAHPYLTGPAGAPPDLADCAKCHRARVPELPGRLEQKQFRHRTHVPAGEQAAASCRECHPSAVTAKDAAALASDARTYTLAGETCKKCHLGGVREVPAEAAPVREVVRFPHEPHVRAGAACTDCHSVGDDGQDVVTSDCRQCHDHKSEVRPKKSENPTCEKLLDGQVKSCVKCHRGEAVPGNESPLLLPRPRRPGTPPDPRYLAQQTPFAGFSDSQFHPEGVPCRDCHKAILEEPGWLGRPLPRIDTIYAARRSPHANQRTKQPEQCLQCHWSPATNQSGGVNGRGGDFDLRKNPLSPAARTKFGNDSKDYPGKKASG